MKYAYAEGGTDIARTLPTLPKKSFPMNFIRSTFAVLLLASVAHAQEPAPQDPFQQDDELPPPPVEVVEQPDGYEYQEPQPGQPAPAQPAPYVQPGQPQPGQPQYAQPGQPQYAQPGYAPQYTPQPRLRREPYHEGMTIPPGGELIERRRTGMIISGAAVFGGMYLLTVAATASVTGGGISGGSGGEPVLYVPVVGPFIRAFHGGTIRGGRVFFVIDGLVQTVGATLLIVGLASKTRYIQYYAESDDGRRQLALSPMVGETNGLALDLRFAGF